ncbi:transporter substrate-binding domain-containing protein [Lutibaculum baratangense]|uniref:Amino acid ABC transporter, binding protein n=1 Tax=Lutibaculum baratangense AMV1 TaxID=631454 RepID=V4RHY5_9HYPH|nr:transporter substrate-binding domain-containing protein [Lutibaculum baratangense]ESR25746.1 amino acid ABC transporter, binding protein [Lutibaculum baratangense AMV1]
MKKTILAAAAALSLAMAPGAFAQEPLKVGVAAEPYPPFSSVDSAGNWSGFDIEIGQAICEEMGRECVTTPVAWDGIIPALTSGKIDMIVGSMSITEERQKVIDFSDRYYYTPAAFVAPAPVEVDTDSADLGGLVLGVQSGTTSAAYVRKAYPDAEIKLYNTQDEVNADLAAGRIDVMLADQAAMVEYVKTPEGSQFEVKAVAPEDEAFGEGIGVGLRKEDDDLQADVNDAIAALLESGRYDEIAGQYFEFDIYGGRE